MTLPVCAELPLMLLFSMLCTDEDGNVVDLRVDGDIPVPLTLTGPTLFGSHRDRTVDIDTDTTTTIETKTFSSSNSGGDGNSNSNSKDNRQRIPYCDESKDEYKRIGVCGDRMDGDDINGYPCGNGVTKKDWRDCNGGLYGNDEDEIVYLEDSKDLGDELGNLMKDDNDEDNDSEDNERESEDNEPEPEQNVENIGDELGDVMD